MHIHKIGIKNFRLLSDVTLSLERSSTTIVGRNNSGKTSLTELFRRVLSEKLPSFRFEDFSQTAHDDFLKSYRLKQSGASLEEIRAALPTIELRVWIRYEVATAALGALGAFIIDLDPACNEALLVFRYQLKDGAIDDLFGGIALDPEKPDAEQQTLLCREMKERVGKSFTAALTAVDPGDATNTKVVEWSQLTNLLRGGFINAQRGLDDITHKDKDVLGKILSALLGTAMSSSADAADRDIAEELTTAVKAIQDDIDTGFSKQLTKLLPALALFGYPGLSDPGLQTETRLDVERLLVDHTRINYAGINGITLPESYNGLGARNLIFILLKLLEYYKSFIAQPSPPSMHLIFIEEPEVHLHPQMQEVFISRLGQIAKVFADKFNGGVAWPVQFIVTTHSSHVANRAPFESIRYFFASPIAANGEIRSTTVKDLGKGLGGSPTADLAFLHKYMTLTRCDLLFADKAVLIEGTTERLLFPAMTRKVDALAPGGPQLASQYISVIEVGGAHAHLFFPLLKFLELSALVVTDLDTVTHAGGSACKVADGTHTSNTCIKKWFEDNSIAPSVLLTAGDDKKIQGLRRIAFQLPETEGASCGRSFEEAFMLANQTIFGLDLLAENERAGEAWERAKKVEKKSDFALKFAIEQDDWVVPHYLKEGLVWLRDATLTTPAPIPAPSAPSTVATPATATVTPS
jgi:putative ATP-dependent endonuclease of OLD family